MLRFIQDVFDSIADVFGDRQTWVDLTAALVTVFGLAGVIATVAVLIHYFG